MPEVSLVSKAFLDAIKQVSILPSDRGWLLVLTVGREFPHLSSFKGVGIRLWLDDAPADDPGINAILRFTVNDGSSITGAILPRQDESLPIPSDTKGAHAPFSRLALTIGGVTCEYRNDSSLAKANRHQPGEENS
ncbi:MAG: hypothetical protein U0487_00520 [Patescibacteria group bacterium]